MLQQTKGGKFENLDAHLSNFLIFIGTDHDIESQEKAVVRKTLKDEERCYVFAG